MKRYWSDGEENEDEPQNEQNAEADILNKLKNKVGTVFRKLFKLCIFALEISLTFFRLRNNELMMAKKRTPIKMRPNPRRNGRRERKQVRIKVKGFNAFIFFVKILTKWVMYGSFLWIYVC